MFRSLAVSAKSLAKKLSTRKIRLNCEKDRTLCGIFDEKGPAVQIPSAPHFQSLRIETSGESFEKTRIDAGFGIEVDPENGLILRFSSEIPQSYPTTISVVPI